ncbi:hypothetical protein T069G_07537 [Trichoderma breve]|uniref:Uncharacterized protein n=1 Tax=Trichoderma breve TaxID=2034170 RepID=A0A9W9BA04_9HYPO|nr:hypothetical protein T069G_07537 [Trichoderma breve]KAJ4859270.1 hypothetical protein T069G_07537 [Trichoderma breve]
MALNSSFGSLMAEIFAIDNQVPTESAQEHILQHGEDIQDVTTTFERQEDTSQETEQPCEEEEQGSNGEEERTNKEPKVECTPVEPKTKKTWTSQWETVFPKSKAVAKNLWYAAKSRTQSHIRTLLVRQYSPRLKSNEVAMGGEDGRAKKNQRKTIGSLSRTILESWFS